MKKWTNTIIATVALAVIICTLFTVFQGKALGFEATTVVVAISIGIVIGIKKIWSMLKRK